MYVCFPPRCKFSLTSIQYFSSIFTNGVIRKCTSLPSSQDHLSHWRHWFSRQKYTYPLSLYISFFLLISKHAYLLRDWRLCVCLYICSSYREDTESATKCEETLSSFESHRYWICHSSLAPWGELNVQIFQHPFVYFYGWVCLLKKSFFSSKKKYFWHIK